MDSSFRTHGPQLYWYYEKGGFLNIFVTVLTIVLYAVQWGHLPQFSGSKDLTDTNGCLSLGISRIRSAVFTHSFIFLMAACVDWKLVVTSKPDSSKTLLRLPEYVIPQFLSQLPSKGLLRTPQNERSFQSQRKKRRSDPQSNLKELND